MNTADPMNATVSPGTPAQLTRRCILAADIDRGGGRLAPEPSPAAQEEARHAYSWAMDQAAAETRLTREDWITRPTGAGELVILPAGVDEARVLGVLVPALASRLRDYNRRRPTAERVRLRVAVHQGLVQLHDEIGFPGAASVTVTRLLGCEPVRLALARMTAANLMLVVSDEIYRDVVAHHHDGLRPELFRRVRVENRLKRFHTEAWIYSPEGDVNGIE